LLASVLWNAHDRIVGILRSA